MASGERHYEELEHTADWAIRVWGADLNALFEHAAEAMFELQGAQLDACADPPTLREEVTCTAMDLPALLVRWLNELLYLSEMHNALYTRFRVQIQLGLSELTSLGREVNSSGGPAELRATAWGTPGRGPLAHVKAVTYYMISVAPAAAGWEATVTFDT